MPADYYDALRWPIASAAVRAEGSVAMGRYDPFNLAIWLEEGIAGAIDANTRSAVEHPEQKIVDATATFLHENAHWWQYAGTPSGFTLAMIPRLQAAITGGLLERLDDAACVKPLFRLHEVRPDLVESGEENIAINDWFDLEYASFLLSTPEGIDMARGDRFFETFGRSLCVLHEHLPTGLALSSIGAEALLPAQPSLAEAERTLASAGASNFDRAATMLVPPIGAQQIMEGHARLLELRYRSLARGHVITWHEAYANGWLEPIYMRALEFFIERSAIDPPADVLAPIVGLFLAACDLALWPSAGVVDPVTDLERLPIDASPGCRFDRIATALRVEPRLAELAPGSFAEWPIEYRRFVSATCEMCGFRTPWSIAETLLARARESGLDERARRALETCRFDGVAAPIDVFVAMHLRALEMRVAFPELPAWTDLAFAGCRALGPDARAQYADAADRAGAPFHLDPRTGQVRVSLAIGQDDDARDRLARNYFLAQAMGDVARQWMARNGPFVFEFCFAPRADALSSAVRTLIDRQFGIDIAEVRVLP